MDNTDSGAGLRQLETATFKIRTKRRHLKTIYSGSYNYGTPFTLQTLKSADGKSEYKFKVYKDEDLGLEFSKVARRASERESLII